MRLSGAAYACPFSRYICVGSAGLLETTDFPNARHATRSLSGAQARTSVSGAGLGGQDAASATSNSTAGRHIPQPLHAKVTGRWLASSTRAHMLPNRLDRLPPSVKR